MKIQTKMIFYFIPFFLWGCKKDESLSPPKNTEYVEFRIHIPSDVNILPAGVMYRSDICKKEKTDSRGERYKEPGYNFININSKRKNGVMSVSVPVNGGGKCKWMLSNTTLFFEYIKDRFSNEIDKSIGNSIIFISDGNSPQNYNGHTEELSGNKISLDKEFFPWIDVDYLNNAGPVKKLIMFGDRTLYAYRDVDARIIDFHLLSESNNVTYSEGPKVKNDSHNNFTTFLYSDGSVDHKGMDFPDIKKLKNLSKLNNKK